MGDESARPTRSSVLRLRGLPFAATESDIEEFFKGFQLKQVQICKRNGRSTGEAYVQVENENAAGNAMQELNCKHMGRRYIEIFEASESDLSPGLEGRGCLGYVLRLRGLPYSATREDVEKFFETIEIHKGEEGVVFSCTASGRPTGEAYVEFLSEEAQLEAMKRHKEHMGSRYIELFKSTKADLLQALEQNRFYQREAEKRRWLAANMPALGHGPMGEPSGVKLQRGSPYSGVEDVTRIFEGFSLGPQPGVQAPHTMQPGQPNAQAIPHDMLLMQQQYLMQQQMMQQQQIQSLRYPSGVGWGNMSVEVPVPPHSAIPPVANPQAPYPSYGGLSNPGMPIGGRGGFSSGSFGYHQYPAGPAVSPSASLPSPVQAPLDGDGPKGGGLEISASGPSHGEGNGGEAALAELQG